MEIRNQSGQALIEFCVISILTFTLVFIFKGVSTTMVQKKQLQDKYKLSKQTIREFYYIKPTDFFKEVAP